MSSQNVYVKFESTANIKIGDTLFTKIGNSLRPILLVHAKSSISCIGIPISSTKIGVSDKLVAKIVKEVDIMTPRSSEVESLDRDLEKPLLPESTKKREMEQHPSSFRVENPQINPTSLPAVDTKQEEKKLPKEIYKHRIKGRVSASSYSSISGLRSNHRMRYAFLLRGDHLGNTGLSVESYITFRHTLDEWEEVQNNINNALKVYSLALKYEFNRSTWLTFGRKINPKISSMGAIDGIQFEKQKGNLIFGVILGSRPDYLDYRLNLDLFQFGGYISLGSGKKAKYHQTTLGFIEQRNHSKIDRRFLYFQHSSSLVKNLNLFSSLEMSLYENINEQVSNSPSLTNLYLSLRYRFSRRLNISASYDTRKNIIYYESYKSFIDKLIEDETRQGVRFHVNYRPFKNVIWGVNTGWRFQKNNQNLSKNLNSYLTFSRIPKLNIRATLTVNFLQTNYLDSKVFGVRISKEILKGKLNGDLNFRMIEYQYNNYEEATRQNIAGINLSMKIIKKLTFYMYYEGTFDPQNTTNNRFNTKIIQRF